MKRAGKCFGALLLALVLIIAPVPLSAEAASDYSCYLGEWEYRERVVPDGYGPYIWYTVLNIHAIENGRVTFDLYGGRSFESWGPSRVASIGRDKKIVTQPMVNGVASFTYQNDGWGNTGRGTLTFREDGIICSVTQETTGPNANYSLTMLPLGKLLHMEGFKPGSVGPVPEGETPFQDVYENMWYVSAVRYVYAESLFGGTSSTTFSPNAPMTRVQLAQALANRTEGYFKEDYAGNTCFTDVGVDFWGCAPIRWAYRNDLVDGVGNNKFSPNSPLTREQLAAFLYRYAKRTGANASFTGNKYWDFPDTSAVSSWATEAMQWAVNNGIINGSGGRLNPRGTASRAQVAQMFLNAKDVLTSTQLLPQEERPDPDLTSKSGLVEKIDPAFVMNSLGTLGGQSPARPGEFGMEEWFTLCSSWLGGAYAAYVKEIPEMPTPLQRSDLISETEEEIRFQKSSVNRAIELFGGVPEEVLELVSGYRVPAYERVYTTDDALVWVLPRAGFSRSHGFRMLSLTEENGKALLRYEFLVDEFGSDNSWAYQGTAVLVPCNNSLGYQIEAFSVRQV